MSDLFRSDKMVLLQLFLHPEQLYYIISELGEAGIAQFEDLSAVSAVHKKFLAEVIKSNAMDRRLMFLKKEMLKFGVKIPNVYVYPAAPKLHEIVDLDSHLEETEATLMMFKNNIVKLKREFTNLLELKYVLELTSDIFAKSISRVPSDYHQNTSTREPGRSTPTLQFVTGIIPRERMTPFEMVVWRMTQNYILFNRIDIDEPIEDPETETMEYKSIFVAFFQSEHIKSRIKKLCVGFKATLYNRPMSNFQTASLINSITVQLEDLKVVLDRTNVFRIRYLNRIAHDWQNWYIMVTKIKAIFHTMNYLNVNITDECLIGECWTREADADKVRRILEKSAKEGVSISHYVSFLHIVPTKKVPPTYNQQNIFSSAFQHLIDSYGVATYREANPAPYTIVTFPFLFAVMFGDLGHAIILVLTSFYLIQSEHKYVYKKPSNEILRIFYNGRYLILLLGIFSAYSGCLYNDIFSKSMELTTSAWYMNFTTKKMLTEETIALDPRENYDGTPYLFGIDPVWHFAQNSIIFSNSLKMKLSVIFGVLHMLFGICMSLANFIYFKEYASIFLEFIPQFIFLSCLFLWMVIMIFLKWILYSADKDKPVEYGTSCAPNVLIYFINMMLFKKTKAKPGCKPYMFEQQEFVQKILIFTSATCVPVLLLGKPIYKQCKDRLKKKRRSRARVHFTDVDDDDQDEEKCSKTDLYTYQTIHTIEFVLGTVSHTASYLRLWALSLAHSQLSDVLWKRIMVTGLAMNKYYIGGFTTFVCFLLWSTFTVAIMVTMEGLSAFLHTLRLHWVEFMSKFYRGKGYMFQPFSFNQIIEDDEADEQ